MLFFVKTTLKFLCISSLVLFFIPSSVKAEKWSVQGVNVDLNPLLELC